MQTVLLVDDEPDAIETLKEILSKDYRVLTATNSREALELCSVERVGCVVLDLQLKSENGSEIAVFLQQVHPRPSLLIASGYVSRDLAIKLCNLGAQGILEKPITGEIVYRVKKALDDFELRNSSHSQSTNVVAPDQNIFRINSNKIMLEPHFLRVTIGDEVVNLTSTEFALLSHLLFNRNRWISRELLMEQVWGNREVSRNLFDTHLSNLRKKIRPLKDAIETVRGRGYFLRDSPEIL